MFTVPSREDSIKQVQMNLTARIKTIIQLFLVGGFGVGLVEFGLVSGVPGSVLNFISWGFVYFAVWKLLVVVFLTSRSGMRFYEDWEQTLLMNIHESLLVSGVADKATVMVASQVGETVDSLKGLSAVMALSLKEQVLGRKPIDFELETSDRLKYKVDFYAIIDDDQYTLNVKVHV